jgi:hypothetical protein
MGVYSSQWKTSKVWSIDLSKTVSGSRNPKYCSTSPWMRIFLEPLFQITYNSEVIIAPRYADSKNYLSKNVVD